MASPCVHGFPKPANCYECMYEGNIEQKPAPPPRRNRKAIAAVFDGHCGGCPVEIETGQMIVSVGEEWWHEECAEWA